YKEYAKPSRLLGVAEPKPCTETSWEKTISTLNVDKSSSFYKIRLQTSNMYGSGQWRPESVSLTIVSGSKPSSSTADEEEEEVSFSGFHCEFDADDILLGEGNDLSMVEIRPCRVSKLSDVDPLTVSARSSTSTIPSPNAKISSEQSMKEYADLKLSLLSYDAMLIIAGTIISNLSADENAAYAFLLGGMCGFSYLLLLQRSVDGLEASAMMSNNREGLFGQLGGGIKGPVVSLGLVVALTLGAAKYGLGDVPSVVSPKEVILGMLGFLVCKLAVLMAAFKPMKSDWFKG
ncbi:hypothetical protein LINPERPRIM_LOCUS36921, partial [Linum perenne]